MNRNSRSGWFALLGIGAFVAYRNRATLQRYLESKGIQTPFDTSGSLRDTIRSGIAKLSGSAEYGLKEAGKEAGKQVKRSA